MNNDDLQKTWQSQEPDRRITIDADVLLREVRWNHNQFRAVILWRDVREVGVALISAPLMILWGEYFSPDALWPVYLLAATMVAIGLFILLDRLRQKRKRSAPSDTLLGWAENSLADMEHQIWLLRNVFWWYLLPPGAAIAAIFGCATWRCRGFLQIPICWKGLLMLLGLWAFAAAVLLWIYRLNQRWVQKEGQPRRQELRELIDNLKSLEKTL